MKIVINEKTLKRNVKIGQYTSLGSVGVLALGMYVTYAYPEWVTFSFACLLIGFIGSQVGIYFGNRWGRRPRIDEQLTANLKGLTRDYTVYHYVTPVSHLLVGPAGVWILEAYYQRGKITYEKGKWKQKGGGFVLQYLKIFAQEGLGRPDLEVETDIENLKKAFQKSLGEENLPPIQAALIFTDERAELEPGDSPLPMLRPKEMKEFFRKTAKANPLRPEEVKRIQDSLPQGVEMEKDK
jgi:hypothetical protein